MVRTIARFCATNEPNTWSMIDLHCHWVAAIDDGARTFEESAQMLQGLRSVGFTHVVATPHMRPGMFPNDRGALREAFETTQRALAGMGGLPEVSLASEHFLDDIVFERLRAGQGLPYGTGKCVLVELATETFPPRLTETLYELRMAGLRVVLAHPERYKPVWDNPALLEPLLERGTLLLLDVAALVGKYGRRPQKAAEWLVDEGFYHAACSDAHRPSDLTEVLRAIKVLGERLDDEEELGFLMNEGPREILNGTVTT